MKVKTILVFPNLMVACFDEAGRQIPELQQSVPELLAAKATALGFDPDGAAVETQGKSWRLVKGENGRWNYD